MLDVIDKDPPKDANELEKFKKRYVKAKNLMIQSLTDDVLEMVKEKSYENI